MCHFHEETTEGGWPEEIASAQPEFPPKLFERLCCCSNCKSHKKLEAMFQLLSRHWQPFLHCQECLQCLLLRSRRHFYLTLPYLTLLYLQQVWKRLASLLFCVPMGCFFPYVFVVFCFWLYFGYMCWDLGLTFFSFGGFLFGLFYSLFRHYTSIRVGSVCLVCLYVSALSFLSSLSFFTFLGGIFVKMFACIQLVYFHGSLVYCHFHLTGFVVFSFCHLQFMPTYYTCSL